MLGSTAVKTKKVVKKTTKVKKEKKDVPKFTESEINGKKQLQKPISIS